MATPNSASRIIGRLSGKLSGKRWVLPVIASVLALALTGCAGGRIGSTAAGSSACGTVNLAVNPWVGYEASIHVVGYIAEHDLGCQVEYKNLKEEVSWQGFQTGDVDAIIENWGHQDLVTKYIDQLKVAKDVGPDGNIGVIGWFVPPWMPKKYPDITNWQNLNKYASLFKTSESGGKGQLLDGDPSYVTNDEALVKNLHLNFQVVYAGSEAALVQAYRQAEKNKTPLIGYFYSPHWFLNEVPLVQVKLPPNTPGCDSNPETVACGYPRYDLNKIVSTKFANSGSPAYTLVKNFKWTNTDQNQVAGWIAVDGMDPEKAAQKWVDAHPAMVKQWIGD